MSPTSPAPLRVAVVGAGAVGCYHGGMLARAGHAVTLIGREQHVQVFASAGLRMQTLSFDEQVPVAASTQPAAVADADVVLFAVKSPDTEATGEQMRPHLKPGALVLCLQNGVDNAERLRAVLPEHDVAAAVVYVATEMAGPGHVRHHGRGELVIEPGPRSREVADALAAAGVPVPGACPGSATSMSTLRKTPSQSSRAIANASVRHSSRPRCTISVIS